jgi:hypothetical protein
MRSYRALGWPNGGGRRRQGRGTARVWMALPGGGKKKNRPGFAKEPNPVYALAKFHIYDRRYKYIPEQYHNKRE